MKQSKNIGITFEGYHFVDAPAFAVIKQEAFLRHWFQQHNKFHPDQFPVMKCGLERWPDSFEQILIKKEVNSIETEKNQAISEMNIPSFYREFSTTPLISYIKQPNLSNNRDSIYHNQEKYKITIRCLKGDMWCLNDSLTLIGKGKVQQFHFFLEESCLKKEYNGPEYWKWENRKI